MRINDEGDEDTQRDQPKDQSHEPGSQKQQGD